MGHQNRHYPQDCQLLDLVAAFQSLVKSLIMKARNRKKEEQLKRLRQKHIQSVFYETAGPSEGRRIRIKKGPTI